MRDRTFRTIGASVVLAGLVVAALIQLSSDRNDAPADIVATDPSTTFDAGANSDGEVSTTPAEPFVYRIGVLSGVSTDNFWAYYGSEPSVWNSYILGPTKPALFTLDPGTGGLVSELAVSHAEPTWNKDGWKVRVHLDDSFAWSDGAPVTASDLAFTFRTVRQLGLGGSWGDAFPAEVANITAVAPDEVLIEFSRRPTLSVWPYGVGLAPVMPEHVWGPVVEVGDAAALYAIAGTQDVSGGPLVVSEVTSDLVVSVSNPGYPRGERPDRVEYHVYADEAALVAAVAEGAVDSSLTPSGIAPERLAVVSDQPDVRVMTSPGNGIRYLGFNLERAPMNDHAFRNALALLLDREELAETIPQTGAPAWTLLPAANTQWFDPDVAETQRTKFEGDPASRLEQAIVGLTAAGYTWDVAPSIGADGDLLAGKGLKIDGQTPQTLTILTPGDAYEPSRPDYVIEIAEVLGALGFDARPVETDFDSVVDLAFTQGDDGALHYDMYLLGWTLGNPALPSYYRPFFAADGEMNNTGYASTVFRDALADYEMAFDAEDAKKSLWTMETALSNDLPYLPLYNSELTEIYRSDRVSFDFSESLGGLQGRLGGISDVRPID